VTVEPGGTTIVVFFGGGALSWKLRQPPKLSGTRTTSSNFFMRWILSGRQRAHVALSHYAWNDPAFKRRCESLKLRRMLRLVDAAQDVGLRQAVQHIAGFAAQRRDLGGRRQ
jgi:hypothetical protein